MPATTRFLAAAASVPGAELGLVSADPVDKLPTQIRNRLSGHWRTDDPLDPGQLADAVRRFGAVDRIFGPLEEIQVPMAQVREWLGIPGMSVETALNFRDKDRMKDVFDRAGIPCARHAKVGSVDDARAFVAATGSPVVVKPPAGSGSRNTFRLENQIQVDQWLATDPPSHDHPVLIEEFVLGDEHSWDAVTIGGEVVFSSVSRYYPTPLDVLQNPWIQWAVLLPRSIGGPEFGTIRTIGPAALRALGLEGGLTHMEWFQRRDGSVAVSEVAVRPPGAQFCTLLSYAHDFDLYRAWAHLMIHDEFPAPERRFAVGAVYVRGQGSGRVVAIHGTEEAQREVAGMVVEMSLPSPGQAPSGHYEGDGYVIVRHPETGMVETALAALVNHLRVEMG